MTLFQGVYKDQYGEEKVNVRIDEDGWRLRMVLRSVEFSGSSLDSLSSSRAISQSTPFPLNEENQLQSFELVCETSVRIVDREQSFDGSLRFHCVVCSSEEEWEDAAFLQFTLQFDESRMQSDWCKAGFEDELTNLETKLPAATYLKCCFNCRFASYNPYVNSGLMGELNCFVDTDGKFAYRGKGFPGWAQGKQVRVQELHLCSKFHASKQAPELM